MLGLKLVGRVEILSLRGKKVLIIDDLPDMRTMLRTLVASLGTDDIKTARDGEQAMTLMEHERFDIVLCDYSLGEGKDGQQVLLITYQFIVNFCP